MPALKCTTCGKYVSYSSILSGATKTSYIFDERGMSENTEFECRRCLSDSDAEAIDNMLNEGG